MRTFQFFIQICLFAFYVICASNLSYAMIFEISKADTQLMAQRVFKNECSVEKNCLLEWNAGEDFLSLGLEHFIWFPSSTTSIFKDSFRSYLLYARKKGEKLPATLDKSPLPGCPWVNRDQFLTAKESQQYKDVLEFMIKTKNCQADYLIETTQRSLKKIIHATPQIQRQQISTYIAQLTSNAQGLYAVIDYLNFKGSGIGSAERYQGEGWGLLQVLQGMHESNSQNIIIEFVGSAERVLRHRVFNAPSNRHEDKWLQGWISRVDTYLTPDFKNGIN